MKDLQIQKKILAEPLHLEAALQYAEIRSSFSDPKSYAKNAYFFYKRMYEDFQEQGDPIAEEYNEVRQNHPEKNRIFEAYMKYLDAQMMKCQAAIARSEEVHGTRALQFLGRVKSTEENLQASFESESNVAGVSYDRFVKLAMENGHNQAVTIFSQMRDAEEGHSKLYKSALDHLMEERETAYYVCEVCGYVADGTRPERCPICGADQNRFVEA